MKMNGYYSEKSNDASTLYLQIGGEKVTGSLETKCPICQKHHQIFGLTDKDVFKIKYCPFCGRKL